MTRKSKQRSRVYKRKQTEIRKRLGMERGEKICGEGRCCQFITREGKKCSREASYHLNMRKAKILGYDLPKYNCCTFCTQHLGTMLGIYGIAGMLTYVENSMSWDEYAITHLDYVENLKTEKGLFNHLKSMVLERAIQSIRQ